MMMNDDDEQPSLQIEKIDSVYHTWKYIGLPKKT